MTPFSHLHEQGSLCLPAAPRSPSLPPRATGSHSSCSAPFGHTVALLELRHPRPRLLARGAPPTIPRLCRGAQDSDSLTLLAELRSPAGHPLSQGDFQRGFWRPSLPCHGAHLDPPGPPRGLPHWALGMGHPHLPSRSRWAPLPGDLCLGSLRIQRGHSGVRCWSPVRERVRLFRVGSVSVLQLHPPSPAASCPHLWG